MSIKTHSDWAVQEMPDVWPLSKFATQQNGDLAPSMSFNFSAEKDFFVFLNGPLTPGVMVVHEDSFEAHSDIRVNMFAAKWTTESEQPLVRSLELYKGYVDDESVATALVSFVVASSPSHVTDGLTDCIAGRRAIHHVSH